VGHTGQITAAGLTLSSALTSAPERARKVMISALPPNAATITAVRPSCRSTVADSAKLARGSRERQVVCYTLSYLGPGVDVGAALHQ
jgi:hypothetical protein